MKPSALLQRLASGQLANVRFADAQRLAEALGFELVSGAQRTSRLMLTENRVPS